MQYLIAFLTVMDELYRLHDPTAITASVTRHIINMQGMQTVRAVIPVAAI